MSALPQPERPEPPAGRPAPRRSLHTVSRWRRVLFGKPIQTEHAEHARLGRLLALPVFSSDAISSVAYASQEILLVLGAAGLWTLANRATYTRLTLGITAAIVCLLVVVATSYWQTIFAYPSGGGSYIVSKENLGVPFGLVAAAALLIDYVLTVSVSIASGVQNLVGLPVLQHWGVDRHVVLLCILCIAIIAFLNLRGLRESGSVFAVPTYFFVGMAVLMVAVGLLGPSLFGWHLHMGEVSSEYARAEAAHAPDMGQGAAQLSGLLLLGVLLRAFANGCSAMTGTEAVSNGIPAFRAPESRNAALTLVAMAIILGTLFLGISTLATHLHVVYLHYGGNQTSPAVIDQLSGAVFGKRGGGAPLYYCMQIGTMLILVLAANTSFADFPRLSAILARDRFLPRQLTNQGDKLAFTNGILMLGAFAIVLVVAFRGSVDRLIPLYAVGVFTAFTLSQSGMVMHWYRERGPGWRWKLPVNGLGAVCTFIVMLVIAYEKFPEGAWIVAVVAAILVAAFAGINKHYEFIRSRLSVVNYHPDEPEQTNTVLLLVPSVHRGIFPALRYARSISPDCRGIHVDIDHADTERLQREWERYVGEEPPLVVLPSPYRSLIGPLLAYLDQVQQERENHIVTVVVPEFVPGKWWHSFLHNANGLLVKYYLSQRPGVIVSNFRYFLSGQAYDAPPAKT